jgi:hypothetical protein
VQQRVVDRGDFAVLAGVVQRAQASMSIPNTRFKHLAQLIATCRSVDDGSAPFSACGFWPLAGMSLRDR